MPDSQQLVKVDVHPDMARNPLSSIANSSMIPQISGEGYKLVERLVDPNAIYLDKITTFLYSAHLMKSPVYDPDSPVPGYKLVKVGGQKWKPNMSMLGYTTTMAEILMAIAEDGSVTRFPITFKLEYFAARQTMAILSMMCANREEWEFDNYTLIYPVGLTIWKAIVATLSRSMPEAGRRSLMDLLIHPNLWFTENPQNMERPKNKWFNI